MFMFLLPTANACSVVRAFRRVCAFQRARVDAQFSDLTTAGRRAQPIPGPRRVAAPNLVASLNCLAPRRTERGTRKAKRRSGSDAARRARGDLAKNQRQCDSAKPAV
jgi:hypothetical protein